ncbi:MAG: NADH-quinone oxidoreductase subunit H, partial [Desulfobacterales bacterium]|nr:NADH-quinone oxidoreductase subunit H [Desulfobacterales bacterium]
SILFILLSAFPGNSKYSILGCIRILSQLISFELI